nr:MAG TPA: hypothetical protein [Caudoviricetes sp.]
MNIYLLNHLLYIEYQTIVYIYTRIMLYLNANHNISYSY